MTFSFAEIITKIIREQELIIGPLAWSEAKKVTGLNIVNQQRGEVNINNGDPKQVVDRLVGQYEHLFGRASREVCREAASDLLVNLSASDIPSSLK